MATLVTKVFLIPILTMYFFYLYQIRSRLFKQKVLAPKMVSILLAVLFLLLGISFGFSLILGVSFTASMFGLSFSIGFVAILMGAWHLIEDALSKKEINFIDTKHKQLLGNGLVLANFFFLFELGVYVNMTWVSGVTAEVTRMICFLFTLMLLTNHGSIVLFLKQFKNVKSITNIDYLKEAYNKEHVIKDEQEPLTSNMLEQPEKVIESKEEVITLETTIPKFPIDIVYIEGYGDGNSESWLGLTKDEKERIIEDVLKLE